MKKIILIISIAFALSSCFKEDTAVSPFPRGDVTSNQLEMNRRYENQIYFDIASNSVVSTNKYGEWDLGFKSYDDYYIRLNSARIMAVQNLGNVPFESVTEALEVEFYERDLPNGNMDSSAIGKWWDLVDGEVQSKNHVYIIDRGRSHDGKKSGLRKLKILEADDDGYTIIFSELVSTTIDTIYIPRKQNKNYITFSFEDGGIVNDLEPASDTWDLIFTRYTDLFDVVGFEIYPVTGILLNTRYCKVTELDSISEFSTIGSDIIQSTTLTNKRDEIGWDWKQVDINTGVYTVNPGKKYIIQDTEQFYYKLRFIGFQKIVDGKSENGYPQFEFKLL